MGKFGLIENCKAEQGAIKRPLHKKLNNREHKEHHMNLYRCCHLGKVCYIAAYSKRQAKLICAGTFFYEPDDYRSYHAELIRENVGIVKGVGIYDHACPELEQMGIDYEEMEKTASCR